MLPSRAIVVGLATLGCAPKVQLFAEMPWTDDRTVIAYALDEADRPVEASPHTFNTNVIEFEVETNLPVRIHIETFGPDFSACEARYEVTGAPWPAPTAAFVTRLVEVDDDALPLVLDVRPGARSTALYFSKPCLPVTTICDRTLVHAELIAFEDADLLTVDRIGDGRLVMGGTNGAFGERDDDGTIVLYDFVMGARIADVVVDGPDRIVGVDARGRLYEVDGAGNVRQQIELNQRTSTLAIDDDGTVYASAHTGTFALARGATVAVPFDDVPRGTTELLIVGEERVAAARGSLYEYRAPEWTVVASELLDDTRLFGDGVRFAAVGDTGIVARSSDGVWAPLPSPFESMGASGAVFDGNGRMLIYGDFGSLAIQEEGQPACRIDPGITSRWWDGVFNSDGRRAYVVGSNGGDTGRPAFLTIDLSDP